MKLATLKDSTRDGKLVVVSKDLTRCSEVGHIARTLKGALDDWAHTAPRLARVALGLETGSQPTMRFHEHDAASPLPRAFFWAGGSGGFSGPRDPVHVAADVADLSMSAQIAVIVDDLEAGAGDDAAKPAILLVLLANDISIGGEPASSAFSPVAVTPDELGPTKLGPTKLGPTKLDQTELGPTKLGKGTALSVLVRLNGKALPAAAGNAEVGAAAVAGLARVRPLTVGSIVATGACVVSLPVAVGDTIRIEMNDRTGHSIFGAIERTVEAGGR